MLAPHLREDAQLRKIFYRRLRAYFFAGASLAQHTWDELDAASMQELGFKVPMLSGLGATETGPSVTFTTPSMGRSGVIGLPAAGTLVKLAPVDEKLELRVRGPCVTPGYWRQPELTAQAFDAEGYYRLGDAVRLIDPEQPGPWPHVRRQDRRRFQTRQRHVGQRRSAARGSSSKCWRRSRRTS